ncbi:MAG: lipoprotein, partial [Elusimicrobia bacterium]|nr:lipoprotein [Elusimicrobiota bacterium]
MKRIPIVLAVALLGLSACARRNASSDSGGAKGGRKILFYRSPMDPKQTSPAPAKDSMGMDFVPVYADEQAASEEPGSFRVP